MFNRKPGQNSSGGPAATPPERLQMRTRSAQSGAEKPSIIGYGLTITGNLDSEGEIHIEGEVHGDIHATRISRAASRAT
jgi:cytoskeletal protein CcmA (bactofilin family)